MASVDKRSPHVTNSTILSNPGPFIARVVNNVDPMKQGSLEVELLRPIGNQKEAGQQLFVVRYLSPFYGVTGIEHGGTDNYEFNETQKSYGFWAVPPDVGVLVMVIFVESDPGQGFWIGCVQDAFMNHMIPGIAASEYTEDKVRESDDQQWGEVKQTQEKFGTKFLPVGEINRKVFKKGGDNAPTPNKDIETNKKPVHPIAEHLLIQGTQNDRVRGVYTSSSRRESPSNVYGWSTPGPIDKRQNAKKGQVGYKEKKFSKFVSRLGGHCIIMDDGNEKRLRKTRPWEGPPEYVDIENGGGEGLPYYPEDDAFRIRTRTGHQFLMHNSEDLIYLTNSRGTAWMEMTSNGKIEFYAKDSISFRSEQDFNFHGERDVNFHANRSVNTFSGSTTTINSTNDVTVKGGTNVFLHAETDIGMNSANKVAISGNTQLDLNTNRLNLGSAGLDLLVGGNLHIQSRGNIELKAVNTLISSDAQTHLLSGQGAFVQSRSLDVVSGSSITMHSGESTSIKAEGNLGIQGATGVSAKSGAAMAIQAGSGMSMKTGGDMVQKGDKIHLNGPTPDDVGDLGNGTGALQASDAMGAEGGQAGIGGGHSGATELVHYPMPGVGPSICNRVPTAEPYQHHECGNPAGFMPHLTDNQSPNMPYTAGGSRYSIRYTSDGNQVPASDGGYQEGYIHKAAYETGGGGDSDMSKSYLGRMPESGDISMYPREWTKDTEFINKTGQIASQYGLQKEELLGLFAIESGWSMDPHAGRVGGHVGLIQFGDAEARMVGTTQGALKHMSRVEQLQYVEKYFQKRVKGRVEGIGQLYMYVAYPAFAHQDPNKVLAAPGGPHSNIWHQNPLWRITPGGPITRQGIENAVQKKVAKIRAILGSSNNTAGQKTNTGPQNPPMSGISPGTSSRSPGTTMV